ncbi:MAG: hypothetical protein LPK45_08400 [Bacteroidota bacterium]|nr:hypothetical protein [Bacteroidota bacterium]MDX5431090.1 hypothetical protein [Bacteroidota bacterium]MDX5469842.1 hypothetical protein [Bacteroidota bacterium]
MYEFIQAIFGENAHYRSITFEEFCVDYGPAYGAKLCPNTSVLFRDKTNGQWAALSLCMPNYHELTDAQPAYRFDRDYEKLSRRTFLIKTVGVHPDYRQKHLMRYLAAYGMLQFPRFYEDAIFCLIREDNVSNSFTARMNKEIVSYGLYACEL